MMLARRLPPLLALLGIIASMAFVVIGTTPIRAAPPAASFDRFNLSALIKRHNTSLDRSSPPATATQHTIAQAQAMTPTLSLLAPSSPQPVTATIDIQLF